MQTSTKELIALENKFWQSMVDGDTDVALDLLDEPSLMVSSHGAMQFDHAAYRKMAEQGKMVVTSFKLSDMNVVFPSDEVGILTYNVKQSVSTRGKSDKIEQQMADSSVWVQTDGEWKCVMHTESPMEGKN